MMTTFELRNRLQEELNILSKKIKHLTEAARADLNDEATLQVLEQAYTDKKEIETALRVMGQFERN